MIEQRRKLLLGLVAASQFVQPTISQQVDSSSIGKDGTAYVTRIVPIPSTVSPEAREMLSRPVPDPSFAPSLDQMRLMLAKRQVELSEAAKKLYPVHVEADTIADVPVRIVSPASSARAYRHFVLINLHGGAFKFDVDSLSESVPIANLTGIRVISVLYRLVPEHPFPAGLDDVVAVYKELLKTYKPQNIGIFGTSAGAMLTAEVSAKLKQLKLPLPAATGMFSVTGDFSQAGDSEALFGLNGLSGHLDPPKKEFQDARAYAGPTDLRNPILSPLYSDLTGFPPTLFITTNRDFLLSGTTILHRAYLRAGVDARLVVFEGLPHGFWEDATLPESKEADHIIAEFFLRNLRQ
jgi:monoterpene epsilon-lactone hydrolase